MHPSPLAHPPAEPRDPAAAGGPVTADEWRALEGRYSDAVGGDRDVVLLQAEAILGIEAIALAVAAPGRTALNVVTGPYGALFGSWLRRGGAEVVDLIVPFDDAVTVDAVAEAIGAHRPDLLAIVHAEAATGGTNPIAEIAAIARDAGLITVLDSVSAVGAEPVPAAQWGIDFTALGAQKSLGGTPTPSAVAVSDRGWAYVESNPAAPRNSSLSLLDLREGWNRTDRTAVPGLPSWLDARALLRAFDRIEAEGFDALHERHRRAAAASVAGLEALGLEPWQRRAQARAPIVTTVRVPREPDARAALRDGALGGILSPGNGDLRGRLLRINHYGDAAALPPVTDALQRLAAALGVDPADAVEAASQGWTAPQGGTAPQR
jgi:aspartate aminotransferase-like enzyme